MKHNIKYIANTDDYPVVLIVQVEDIIFCYSMHIIDMYNHQQLLHRNNEIKVSVTLCLKNLLSRILKLH